MKRPLCVSATRLVLSTKGCVTRRSSSRFSSRLTSEIETLRRPAALVKLPASATATNASRPSQLCIHILIFAHRENCFQKNLDYHSAAKRLAFARREDDIHEDARCRCV